MPHLEHTGGRRHPLTRFVLSAARNSNCPQRHSIPSNVPTWNTQVATGIHLAWSLPVPLRATARSFSSCQGLKAQQGQQPVCEVNGNRGDVTLQVGTARSFSSCQD